jgi:hypothetical protein
MTTLTIQVPDSQSSVIDAIAEITKNAGLKISIDSGEDSLSDSEFESLLNASKEAVLIKKGLSKATPASEMWND